MQSVASMKARRNLGSSWTSGRLLARCIAVEAPQVAGGEERHYADRHQPPRFSAGFGGASMHFLTGPVSARLQRGDQFVIDLIEALKLRSFKTLRATIIKNMPCTSNTDSAIGPSIGWVKQPVSNLAIAWPRRKRSSFFAGICRELLVLRGELGSFDSLPQQLMQLVRSRQSISMVLLRLARAVPPSGTPPRPLGAADRRRSSFRPSASIAQAPSVVLARNNPQHLNISVRARARAKRLKTSNDKARHILSKLAARFPRGVHSGIFARIINPRCC